MGLQLRKINEEIIDKWLAAIGLFSKDLKGFLGELLDGVYATEDPELGVEDYNVIVVVKEPLDEEMLDAIYVLSAKACEKIEGEFAIMPKVVVKGSPEADEYVRLLERVGTKIF